MIDYTIFYKEDPYNNFCLDDLSLDIQGWNYDHPIFADLIDKIQPNLIIEVGTWKGASAIGMGNHIKKIRIECKIICVDTWLGGLSHIVNQGKPHYPSLKRRNGYPMIYSQFIYNVIKTKLSDIIIPFPQTSVIAARYFARLNIKADLIYIDGSHDLDDVSHDIVAYWQLLNDNGVMFGDDYGWDGVHKAVERSGIDFKTIDHYWVMKKCQK